MEIYATKLSTIKQKKKMRIQIENRPILLTYTEHGVFAMRDKCPHMGATLSNGILKNGVITCKDHGLPISVETGEVTNMAKADYLRLDEYSLSVRTYKTIVKEDKVYIDL